jgi:hypothetical protein
MPPTVKIPTRIEGRHGKPSLLPRRKVYEPYAYTQSGKPKTYFGHAYPGYPTFYYNPTKRPASQVRTVLHEALHAWEPIWWRGYADRDGPPEWMVRKLESCVYDLLVAFLEAQES